MTNTSPLLKLIAGILLFSSNLNAAYEPTLPKPGPLPERIVVLDYRWEFEHGMGNDRAVQAIANTVQGLVNRVSATKIYLKNQPIRVIGNGVDLQRVTNLRPGVDPDHSASDAMLALLPTPKQEIDLSTEKRPNGQLYSEMPSPLTSYLLDNFGIVLSGTVALYSNNGWWDEDTAGMRGAAIAVAGFENALPVNQQWLNYVQQYHSDLFEKTGGQPRIIDVSHFKPDEKGSEDGNIAALRWIVDRYVKDIIPGENDDVNPADFDKLRSRKVTMTAPSGSNYPCAIDYAVAANVINYFMRFPRDASSKADALAALGELLNEEHYPLGIPQWGEVETSHLNQAGASHGYTAMHGQIPNCSVTAAYPTNPSDFNATPEGKALPLGDKVIYVSGNGPDGDALDFFYYGGFRSLYYDVAAGEVPNGWRINPILIDLFPHMWAWLANTYPDSVDLISSMNDGGMPQDPVAQQAWADIYLNYRKGGAGSFRCANFLGPYSVHKKMHKLLPKLDWDLVVMEYQGNPGVDSNSIAILDDTVYTNQITRRGPNKEVTPDDPSIGEDIAQLKRAILAHGTDAGTGFFFLRYAGETGQNFPSILKRIRDETLADSELKAAGYQIEFVLPRDWAATYRANAAK